MQPRWRNVLRTLGADRVRSGLVVGSIAIGVIAFGTVLATRDIVLGELRRSYVATNPASATISTEPFDAALEDAARRVAGVADAEGMRTVRLRIRLPGRAWDDATVRVIPDDGLVRIGMLTPWRGPWPLADRALALERASLARIGAGLGDTIEVQIHGQDVRRLPLTTLAHDLSLPPAPIAGRAFGYVTAGTMTWLGGPEAANQLAIVVAEQRGDAGHIRQVAAAVEQVIRRGGRDVYATDVPTPLQHPAEVILPTVIALLTTMGLLALGVSMFLIINTIDSLLMQQLRQIGIMRAIGASSAAITGMYLALAAAFGVLALLIAVPLAMLATYGFARFLAGQLNVDIHGIGLPLEVVALQILAAVSVPMIAAALPVRATAALPVRVALAGQGAALPRGTWLDRLVGRLPGLDRPARLSVRNTVRRRGRLVRTLSALVLGGAVFVSVMTLRASLYRTLDASIASQQYDLEVQFGRPYRTARVAAALADVPSITRLEGLRRALATPVHSDGSTGEDLNLRSLDAGSVLFAPRMAGGRWLAAGDARVVVLTTNYRTKDPRVQPGDWITLRIGDRDSAWQVIGFIEELIPPVSPAWAYVPLHAFAAEAGGTGRSDTVRLATAQHRASDHAMAQQQVEAALLAQGFELQTVHTRSADRAILDERFQVLTSVLGVLAVLIGAVGGLGLAGTMGINVRERSRELGVMRAIGASDRQIRRIVIGEGLTIGLLAWLLGMLLALPMSLAMCIGFGIALLNTPLEWTFSLPGVAGWLVIIVVIAIGASAAPARDAVRTTVREVLAYE